MWMNEMEIEDAADLLRNDAVMGVAAKYLDDYKELINSVSDGWAYWSYGTKCADTLSKLVDEAAKQKRYGNTRDYKAPTEQDVNKAIQKIVTFVNRCEQLKSRGIKPPEKTPFQASFF